MHYARWKKHGDPSIVKKSGPVLGSYYDLVPTYDGVHARIARARGKASEHTCSCGAQAKDWAYDHSDPNELTGRGGPYSLDIMRYDPMCQSCHQLLDRGAEVGSPT